MRVKGIREENLSDRWYRLKQVTYEYQRKDGTWETHGREVFDRGDGAVILLVDPHRETVLLTRQVRIPTFLNGNFSGFLTEACAGALDGDDPRSCVIREALEETGHRITKVRKLFECFMSPGAVTERLHFFLGEYSPQTKVAGGGGLDDEQEEIEVLEFPVSEAQRLVDAGEIQDAKTILLLQYVKINGLAFQESL